MFCINREVVLDANLLSKMIHRFHLNQEPQMKKYKNYYSGVQKILQKAYTDPSKPCNRTVINYVKNICDSYAGYIASPGFISYNSNSDIEDIMNVLRYNDYQYEDNAFLLDALIYGTACELMFIDTEGKIRFKLIDPTTCFPVYDDSLTNDLLYFVRIYKQSDWEDSDNYYVDVYSDHEIARYTMNGMNGWLTLVNVQPHYFNQCPANVFSLPDEKSIFDCIIGLQDAVNELLSSEVDDYSAFCDAFLVLEGIDADTDDVASMKSNRVLILPEGAKASWLTKNMNDAQVENILQRLHESIYRVAQCPDFSSDSFTSGVSSGIAIRYKLTGMENKAGSIEAAMKKSLQRRIEIICGIASLKFGEEVFRDIQIQFKRNIPEDITDSINLVNSLQGIVSDATLLSQLDFVDDPATELEQVKRQKAENMSLYSFSIGEDDTDE